ncbi:L-rhamnose mutarotase [Neisseria sp. Ec49-e6-T10]|uniref:L-rhamnose mutarotase n=1 Tax=Neisseria sp. Ec49-e6-T10 TaxID=3140744 RepID=UPI003EB93C87
MSKITRYCQALDLVDEANLIKEYETIHQQIWPEVAQNIRHSGIVDMQIWRLGTRLFMIMDVDETFSFERSAQLNNNPTVIKWEEQMWRFQKPTPWTPDGSKWVLMEQIFDLSKQP